MQCGNRIVQRGIACKLQVSNSLNTVTTQSICLNFCLGCSKFSLESKLSFLACLVMKSMFAWRYQCQLLMNTLSSFLLQVFSTREGKGWGLRTLEDLPKGTFVCEYVGIVFKILIQGLSFINYNLVLEILSVRLVIIGVLFQLAAARCKPCHL